MSFLAILKVLNFDFIKFEQLSSAKFIKIQSSESLNKIAKNYIFEHLILPKLDFMQNLSAGKMIKHQQSQALTSHFELFWSTVHWHF